MILEAPPLQVQRGLRGCSPPGISCLPACLSACLLVCVLVYSAHSTSHATSLSAIGRCFSVCSMPINMTILSPFLKPQELERYLQIFPERLNLRRMNHLNLSLYNPHARRHRKGRRQASFLTTGSFLGTRHKPSKLRQGATR